jgi:hypothetical protein
MFPQRGPYGERCSVYTASGLFIHIYLSESPVEEPFHEMGGKYTVTVQGATHGRKAYIQWGASCRFTKFTICYICTEIK